MSYRVSLTLHLAWKEEKALMVWTFVEDIFLTRTLVPMYLAYVSTYVLTVRKYLRTHVRDTELYPRTQSQFFVPTSTTGSHSEAIILGVGPEGNQVRNRAHVVFLNRVATSRTGKSRVPRTRTRFLLSRKNIRIRVSPSYQL